MRLKDYHEGYLERVSRRLSQRIGRSVSKREVLEAILDLALLDEGLFDPEDPGTPMSSTRREILKTEAESRTTSMTPQELLDRVLLGQSSCPGTTLIDEVESTS